MGILTKQQIAELSVEERLELFSRLWDSFDEGFVDEHTSLTPAQMEELEARLETLEEDRKEAVSWEEIKADMLRRRG